MPGLPGIMLSAYIGVASRGYRDGLYPGFHRFLGDRRRGVHPAAWEAWRGTFPGVLILTVLKSLMTILGISEAGKFICQGVVIAVMVALNQMKAAKK